MREANQTGDYTKAVAAIKEVLAKTPNDGLKMQLFGMLAGPAGQSAEAWKIGEELLDANKGNAMMMNQLAWTIVDPEGGVKEPNLALALKAAEAGYQASKGENSALIDTLARVVFLKGDVARAIELQKQAIEKTPEGAMKTEMKKALAEYEAALKKA
jgi:tetratricopeptide (TPR) repeat protein